MRSKDSKHQSHMNITNPKQLQFPAQTGHCTFWSGDCEKKVTFVLFSIVIMFTDGTTQMVPVCPASFLPYGTAVSFDVCFLFHFFSPVLQTSSTSVIDVFHYLWNHGAHNLGTKPSQEPKITSLITSVLNPKFCTDSDCLKSSIWEVDWDQFDLF